MLVNAFRAVIATTPEDLLPMVGHGLLGCWQHGFAWSLHWCSVLPAC